MQGGKGWLHTEEFASGLQGRQTLPGCGANAVIHGRICKWETGLTRTKDQGHACAHTKRWFGGGLRIFAHMLCTQLIQGFFTHNICYLCIKAQAIQQWQSAITLKFLEGLGEEHGTTPEFDKTEAIDELISSWENNGFLNTNSTIAYESSFDTQIWVLGAMFTLFLM